MTSPFLVDNEDPHNFVVEYHVGGDEQKRASLASTWQKFNRYDPALSRTYKIWCRPTDPNVQITVDHYMPQKSPAGHYRVETFVPAKHSNSHKALFTVTHDVVANGESINEENALCILDMTEHNDVWVPLGEFYLDSIKNHINGRVRQYGLSLENPPANLSFGPVRWIPLFSLSGKGARLDAPVGTKPERDASFPSGRVMFGKYPIWCGQWFDVNPFLTWYEYGYHTGADLNLPGVSSADKGKEIYAVGDGTVTYAGAAGSWGNIIVIEHSGAQVTLPNGHTQRQTVYSRYGHVADEYLVKPGREVDRGTLIAHIGLPAGATSGWHLHFDVCYTDLLKKRPAHWPDVDTIRRLRYSGNGNDTSAYQSSQAAIMREVVNNYTNPLRFIQDNH